MWKTEKKAPILEFIIINTLITILSEILTVSLETIIASSQNEILIVILNIIYALNGLFIATPSPMIATYIVLKRHNNIKNIKEFIKRIFENFNKSKTIIVLIIYCSIMFAAALLYGTRTDYPFYYIIIALPIMILGGGVEEIGWRGFLQPSLEKKYNIITSTLITAIVWIPWHTITFVLESGNHYQDSFIGFAIWLTVWSYGAATLYRITKSVFACVLLHAFINSIGAVFDWNLLFDSFPNKIGMYIVFILIIVISTILHIKENKNLEKN